MKFLTISKAILALTMPFLIFLGSANYITFDKSYYASKLSEYEINIPKADSLNEKTVDFVSGKNNELPDAYNEREKQHLNDVRNVVKLSMTMLYSFALVSISLILSSALILKSGSDMENFTGKALAYGGFLTIGIAGLLLISINLNFTTAFDSFHKLFFQQGTYTFDPDNDIIVRIYPEQLFMDLGLKILKWALFVSALSIIIGMLLIARAKNKKNKNRQTKSNNK